MLNEEVPHAESRGSFLESFQLPNNHLENNYVHSMLTTDKYRIRLSTIEIDKSIV